MENNVLMFSPALQHITRLFLLTFPSMSNSFKGSDLNELCVCFIPFAGTKSIKKVKAFAAWLTHTHTRGSVGTVCIDINQNLSFQALTHTDLLLATVLIILGVPLINNICLWRESSRSSQSSLVCVVFTSDCACIEFGLCFYCHIWNCLFPSVCSWVKTVKRVLVLLKQSCIFRFMAASLCVPLFCG